MRNSWLKNTVWLVLSVCVASAANARGVSPYLPMSVSPALERDYERVLILAGKPIMRRPIPAAVVLDALPTVCPIDRQLCERVRESLKPYQANAGITNLTVDLAATTGDSDRALPNAHGRTTQSNWQVSGNAFYQPSDYLLLSAGGIAYDSRARATGTMLSMGFDFAQLDIGFRDHWLSPLSGSSMLISTEAPTMPSVTLSNYEPLTPLGFTYEVFAAKMSKQNGISYFGGTTDGSPHLTGLQLGIEPVTGYALTLNRVMQYGGGARGGGGVRNFLDSLWHNSNQADQAGAQEEFGNQVASVTSSIQFPGAVPFAVNIEYAGEDNSYGGKYRLGDDDLSLGIDFPRLWQRFDLQYEVSEWQNVWYTHHLYPQGLTEDRYVLGHWFGDQRQFGDQVGGNSHELRIGYHDKRGAYWQGAYRTLAFVTSVGYQTLPAVPYKHQQELELRYTSAWKGHEVSGGLAVGRDVFGDNYGRLSASVDLVGGAKASTWADDDSQTQSRENVDFFIDAGVNHSRVRPIFSIAGGEWQSATTGYHVGIGARRPVSERSAIGVRLEVDDVDSEKLLSLRALDYRYKLTSSVALGAFIGVGRYDTDAPAFGWYGGAGLQWMNVLPKWDAGFDWRYYDKMSRNRVLPNDPPADPQRPRLHFDVEGQTLYISRRF